MEPAGIKWFFTNHSAARTAGTRLFRAISATKVHETTGHSSNAIDKYQITSDEQRQTMSEVLQGQHLPQIKEVDKVENEAKKWKLDEESATVSVECSKM